MKTSKRLFLTAAADVVVFFLLVFAAGCNKYFNEGSPAGAQKAVISDAHMTSSVDENGVPVDTIDTVATTGTWYVSAFLSNTQPNTTIRFIWYNIAGKIVEKTEFDPKGISDIYVYSSFTIPGAALEGQYHVDIIIDNDVAPTASVNFIVYCGTSSCDSSTWPCLESSSPSPVSSFP